MAITTEQVKELRDKTGISVMQCKQALEETDGDMEKALVILQKKSAGAAAKKSDRTLGDGVVSCYVHNTNKVGTMIVLACETDFVAKNEEFISLAREIAMHTAASCPDCISRDEVSEEQLKAAKEVFEDEAKDKPDDIRDKIVEGKMDSYFSEKVLLEQPYIKDQDKTIKSLIEEATQKFGERIEVAKCTRFSVYD